MNHSVFFFFKRGRGRVETYIYCSQCVPIMISSSSQKFFKFPNKFPIALQFDQIWCAQSCLLLTYIGGPKGKALYLHIETSIISILGKFPKFQFSCFLFGDGRIKVAHSHKRKKYLGGTPI
jgi:hypothetical protein